MRSAEHRLEQLAIVVRDKNCLIESTLWRDSIGPQVVFSLLMAIEESVSNSYAMESERPFLATSRSVGRSRPVSARSRQCFEESAISDSADLENLESFCGRGVLLMRNYMSDADFHDARPTVVMRKTICREG